MDSRMGKASRETLETAIDVMINLDGTGVHEVATGIPLFDHLVSSWAFHSGFDLKVSGSCRGLESRHHLVEDIGIALGKALRDAYGDAAGMERFGHACLPMDDALVLAAVDMGGRGSFRWDFPVEDSVTDGFECRLAGEFLRAFCANAGISLHLKYIWGSDPHHLLEAGFKAAAVAMREAATVSGRRRGAPSSKGMI